MIKTCANPWCSKPFEITPDDLAFYEKVSPVFNGKKEMIPPPTRCPECRQQRRLVRRNERSLYRHTCSITGKFVISIYAPTAPIVICDTNEWWKDTWDPLKYAQMFQETRSVTKQIQELYSKVPRPSLHVMANENSDYVNQCGFSRHCYLSFNTDYSEGCCYCSNAIRCRDCFDVLNAEQCELCFESHDIDTCYNVRSSSFCKNCSDISHCSDCIGCRDCIGCINLRNKQYCIFNQQYSEEEYAATSAAFLTSSFIGCKKLRSSTAQNYLQHPRRSTRQIECENCAGDGLRSCKNCHHCFDCFSNEDVAYCAITSRAKDMRDNDTGGYDSELCMELISSGLQNVRCSFCTNLWGNCSDVYYCEVMMGCSHCFGCCGLRHQQYCILNKQYTKEEYERLVPKIIEKMRADGEWGEFFPPSMCPFGYNETVAQEYFPLTKEQALERGFNWSDYEPPLPKVEKIIKATELPDKIEDVPDDILQWAIECETTKKPFKIIKQELEFYRKMNLPIPHFHPDERHRRRMARRNPRKLWNRSCAKCQKPIATSYSPERPEIVHCESCYLSTVY